MHARTPSCMTNFCSWWRNPAWSTKFCIEPNNTEHFKCEVISTYDVETEKQVTKTDLEKRDQHLKPKEGSKSGQVFQSGMTVSTM